MMKQGFGKQSQFKVKGKGKVTELKIVDWEDINIDKKYIIDMLREHQWFPVCFNLDGYKVSCAARIRVDKKSYTSEMIVSKSDPLAELLAKNQNRLDNICKQVAKELHDSSPEAREIIKFILLSRLI